MADSKKVVKAEVQIDVTGLDDATVKQITDALGHEQQSKIVKSALANRARDGYTKVIWGQWLNYNPPN